MSVPTASVTKVTSVPLGGRTQPRTELSAAEARRLALHAQGMIGVPDRRAGVKGMLHGLGAVQLDTISVLARSHELVPYARLGAVGREAVEKAYWNHEAHGASTFEYWAHAACILPVEEWPTFAYRRADYRRRENGGWGMATSSETTATVLGKLRDLGPCTTADFGGARKSAEWWDWSDTKIAVEKLLATGDVVCVERRGWRRVYDLPERALPKPVLDAPELTVEEAHIRLLALAGARLGVGTIGDLADYYRLKIPDAKPLMDRTGLVPVTVRGWTQPAWADPAALDLLASGGPRGRHRTTLLSPFDSLIWERGRMERIFGMVHRIEAYTPAAERVHGYFAMPLLAGGKLLGRVDPKREGKTLIAKKVSLDSPTAARPMAEALREAASWVGCDNVVVELVTGTGEAELRAELA
ncbi:crosslink repair DNA glycosylase YcaQ family protein [Catenulispora subtropica]|uniref:Crosslink repair DNA glycosylase YcaQ family protein n=1 Tax=Catenulispora subtropica TaxID=450798 RepID=A0ABP5CD97_9ACTN